MCAKSCKNTQKNGKIQIYLYEAPVKKSAFPGTELPASERDPFSMSPAIHSGDLRPRPTSINEPTMALTMLRRKRLAFILNTM